MSALLFSDPRIETYVWRVMCAVVHWCDYGVIGQCLCVYLFVCHLTDLCNNWCIYV